SSMLRRKAANFLECARIAEINRDVALFHGAINRVAEIAPRDDGDVRIAFGQIDYRLAHSTARTDQRHAHPVFHFAFSNSSSVLRSRTWFASVIPHNGKRTSPDIAPRQPSAAFTGTGFGSINKSLKSGKSLRCKA